MAQSKINARQRRHERIRKNVYGTASKPRLSIFRSLNNIYAQLIDDTTGKTLIASSSLDKDVSPGAKHGGNVASAKKVGASLAQKALDKKIKDIVFDRSGYKYHGCVKALADAAREQGLKF